MAAYRSVSRYVSHVVLCRCHHRENLEQTMCIGVFVSLYSALTFMTCDFIRYKQESQLRICLRCWRVRSQSKRCKQSCSRWSVVDWLTQAALGGMFLHAYQQPGMLQAVHRKVLTGDNGGRWLSDPTNTSNREFIPGSEYTLTDHWSGHWATDDEQVVNA